MKKPQYITIIVAVTLTAGIYVLGSTNPRWQAVKDKTPDSTILKPVNSSKLTFDSILASSKKLLNADRELQAERIEQKLKATVDHSKMLHIYHELARFWADSAGIFEPYAWYLAEAARLENSEKSLTFAGLLFLENLQRDTHEERRQWKAMQAKELFERSLRINPANDSVKISLGAVYLFGGISNNPMDGLQLIRDVSEKDSSHAYAQFMLGKASIISGQYDKAAGRFEAVLRLQPENSEASLLLAEVFERTGKKVEAVYWYRKSLSLVSQENIRKAISDRIRQLEK